MSAPVAPAAPDQFIEVAKFDWLVLRSWRYLHAVLDDDWTAEHRDDMAAEWAVSHPVRLACGRTAGMVCIPGFGSRLSLPRCKGCCRALGYVNGTGSPKNDPGIRPLLGLAL